MRQANVAVNFIDILRPDLIERGEWFEIVHEDLKRDGVRYLADVSGELRKTLSNEEILKLSDQLTPLESTRHHYASWGRFENFDSI